MSPEQSLKRSNSPLMALFQWVEHSSPRTPSSNCLNDDEGGLSYGLDVPYEYREAPFYTRIQDIRPLPNTVNRAVSSISLSLLLLLSIASSGCMGLAMQRELMEGMRDDPREEIVPVEPIVQAHIFAQNECILPEIDSYSQETDCYSNESVILVDETVSKMLLDFSVSFEWSSTVGEFLGNNTDELRFVEITLLKPNGDKCWEYLATSSVGQMSLELRSESDCTISIGNSSGFTNGNWVLQVRARGYALSAPIDTLSFEDEFRVSLWVTKKCIVFPEIHAEGECTFSSELE